MRINVNPETTAGGFGYAAAGTYDLRVVKGEIVDGPNAQYIKWEFEFVDLNTASAVPGQKVGHIFENTTLKADAQFRLRQLTDAVGIAWGDFEIEDLVGKEFKANVGVKNYQDILSNEVKRYIKA